MRVLLACYRERQKRWAERDPDLRSLWDDPRFQWLVGSAGSDGIEEGEPADGADGR